MKQQLPVFLINLKRSEKRLQKMAARLDRLGFEYRLIEAVDGSCLAPLQLSYLNDLTATTIKQSHRITAGEIGCFLSHFEAYRIMREENINRAMIIEDDCIPYDGLRQIIDHIDKMKTVWHVIHLVASTKLPLRPNTYHLERINKNHFLSLSMGLIHGTPLYLMQRSYAIELLTVIDKIFLPIDTILFQPPYPVRLPHIVFKYSKGKMIQDAGIIDPDEKSTIRRAERFGESKDLHFIKIIKKTFNPKKLLKPIKWAIKKFTWSIVYRLPQKDRLNKYFPDYKTLFFHRLMAIVIGNIDWSAIKINKLFKNKFTDL